MRSIHAVSDGEYPASTPSPTWVNVPRVSSAQFATVLPGEFSTLHPNSGGIGTGFALEMPEPVLCFHPWSVSSEPLDMYLGPRFMWIVSDAARNVFQDVDDKAFVWRKARVVTKEGATLDLSYWVCDIVRHLDALDERRSAPLIEITPAGLRRASPNVALESVFNVEAIGAAHVFRGVFHPLVHCDDAFKVSCERANLSGITFLRLGHAE